MPSSTSKKAFAKQALDAHNKYRAKHQVPPLKWSEEIAKDAQAWAEKLARERRLQHASQSERKGTGENIAMFSGKFETAGEEATNMWYSEVKDYRFNKPGFQGIIRSLNRFMLGNPHSFIQLGNGFFYGLHQRMILSCQ